MHSRSNCFSDAQISNAPPPTQVPPTQAPPIQAPPIQAPPIQAPPIQAPPISSALSALIPNTQPTPTPGAKPLTKTGAKNESQFSTPIKLGPQASFFKSPTSVLAKIYEKPAPTPGAKPPIQPSPPKPDVPSPTPISDAQIANVHSKLPPPTLALTPDAPVPTPDAPLPVPISDTQIANVHSELPSQPPTQVHKAPPPPTQVPPPTPDVPSPTPLSEAPPPPPTQAPPTLAPTPGAKLPTKSGLAPRASISEAPPSPPTLDVPSPTPLSEASPPPPTQAPPTLAPTPGAKLPTKTGAKNESQSKASIPEAPIVLSSPVTKALLLSFTVKSLFENGVTKPVLVRMLDNAMLEKGALKLLLPPDVPISLALKNRDTAVYAFNPLLSLALKMRDTAVFVGTDMSLTYRYLHELFAGTVPSLSFRYLLESFAGTDLSLTCRYEKRGVYCRNRYLQFCPFVSKSDMYEKIAEHEGDFEAAYEAFTETACAPECCKDDFREDLIIEDGEEVDNPDLATRHEAFAAFSRDPAAQEVQKSIHIGDYDWATHTTDTYTVEQIQRAFKWDIHQAKSATPREHVVVTRDELNAEQRYVFDATMLHANTPVRITNKPNQMLAMICGTAGSGKTYLVRALKHVLGDRLVVCAPTGVAADNIGGCTYQSKIPLPRLNIDRPNIRTAQGQARYKRLVLDWEGVEYLIIDEMSMVGRRSLGQIDDLLRQARNNNLPFGGINIILVGDHGQLPPVKDHRCYDWTGVRHKSQKRFKEWLCTALPWQQRGVEMYEKFTTVYFLESIMRVTSTDPDAARFRDVQLRMRDGEITREDYEFLSRFALSARSNSALDDFKAPDVKKLTTTRANRHDLNIGCLQHEVAKGTPAIHIKAHNDSKLIEGMHDDVVGVVNDLFLCNGAYVMITHNISVELGLVNGTMGVVFDIIWNTRGNEPLTVLIALRKKTATTDGYSGPSFFSDEEAEELDIPNANAIVAITWRTEEIFESQRTHTRRQFPLMLAWALTIHKAQGLTLKRVIIDAGDDEKNVGLLFVAITRVRHPTALAFDPMPSFERVTSIIANKPALRLRKMHERQLRQLSSATAFRLKNAGIVVPDSALRTSKTLAHPEAALITPEANYEKQSDEDVDDEHFMNNDDDDDIALHQDTTTRDAGATAPNAIIRISTDMTIPQLRSRRQATLDPEVAAQLNFASTISAFFNLPDVYPTVPSPFTEFISTLISGKPSAETKLRHQETVTNVIHHRCFPLGQPLRLTRSFLSRLLSDTNAEHRPRTDTSWYDERHVDTLGHEAAQASSGRLHYISGSLLHQLAMTAENRALPDDVFHGITETTQVIASIIYVGHHWATTWWCPGSSDWFFAEGLHYDVKPAQCKFRDCIESHFTIQLNHDPKRLYIGTQHDLKYDGTLNPINCGIIAVRVLHGLSHPHEQRYQQLHTLVVEYMNLVPDLAFTGVNDAISHLACRRWRVQQALRLFQWAVAQREEGQATLPHDPFE
jgi:hypothetical protein